MVNLKDMTIDELNFSLSKFLIKVKKGNGQDYPGETLRELLLSLQMFLDSLGKQVCFLSDKDYLPISNALDNMMKKRARQGLNINRRQAEVITLVEEELLWENGELGTSQPRQLFNTLVYVLGLNFALRAGAEHRNLRYANNCQIQIIKKNDSTVLRYTEDISKANQGGLKHRTVSRKVVDAYPNLKQPERDVL